MAAMHDHVWDEEAGEWRPDGWDLKARAVIAYRDQVADSVDGEVPAFGTAEWAAADERTQAAAYARHERDVAAAQGKAISDRMAAESAERRVRIEASQQVAAEFTRRRHANDQLRREVREQRQTDAGRREAQPRPWEPSYNQSFPQRPRIPTQRRESTAATVARARAACRAVDTPAEPIQEDEPGDGHCRVRV